MCPHILCRGHAFPGWVPSSGDGRLQTGAVITLLEISPAGAGSVCTGQGWAGPVLWEWPLVLVLRPRRAPPSLLHLGLRGLRGHFPLGRLALSSLPGPWATERGGQNYLGVDYYFPQEKGGIIIILLPPCDLG